MLLLARWSSAPLWSLVLVDASLLSVVLVPFLYFLVLRPLEKRNAQRDQAERERRASEAQLRATLDATVDGILAVDDHGKILHGNARFAELWRIPPALVERRDDRELLNFVLQQLVDPDAFVAKVQSLYGSDEEASDTLHFTDGRTFERHSVPMSVTGTRIGRVWSFRDVSERKLAERQLTESHDLLVNLAKLVPGVLYQFRLYPDGRSAFPYASPAINDIYEVTPEEVREDATPVFGRLHPDDAERVVALIQESARNLQEFYCEFRVSLPRQGVRWRWSQAHPERTEDGGTLWHGIISDITERKLEEQEKLILQSQLEHAQRLDSVGRLAGGIAHDFNNMLGVILGNTEMALLAVHPEQPLHADLREIQKAATRSADLTRQLLAFARRQTVAPKVLDLNATVPDLLAMLQRLLGEDIRISWRPAEPLWPVRMDPTQMDQILTNLCVNARHAITGAGTLEISTANRTIDEAFCATHADAALGDHVQLTVRDTGCGMDAATLARIFEPFFTTKGVGEGTGLGLATVYGAVRQNHGFIAVTSLVGEGTTFKIYLPRYLAEVAPAPIVEPGSGPTAPRGRETILLVEDEPALLALTTRALEKLGYIVVSARGPGEAMRLAREHTGAIHLVLTDVVMPEMNGWDLVRTLLSLYPRLKPLFMSGYAAGVLTESGMLLDDTHFIEKPFAVSALAAKVREVLDGE